MWLKYVFKNIRSGFSKNKKIYITLILSQLVAVSIILFAYDIFCDYSRSLVEVDEECYMLEANITDDSDKIYMKELKACFEEILKQSEDRLDYFFIGLSTDIDCTSTIHSEYKAEKYDYAYSIINNINIEEGRIFSKDEINSNKKVIFTMNYGEVGEKINILGDDYEIVGKAIVRDSFGDIRGGFEEIEFPYTSCPDDASIYVIILNFKELPKSDDYKVFKDVLESNFGERIEVVDYKVKDIEEIISINTVIKLSMVIGLISAIDVMILYLYVLNSRKRKTAIYEINGAKKIHCILINEIEIALITIINTIISVVVYFTFRNRLLTESALTESNEMRDYIVLSGVYVLVIFIVSIVVLIIYSRKKIISVVKEGK